MTPKQAHYRLEPVTVEPEKAGMCHENEGATTRSYYEEGPVPGSKKRKRTDEDERRVTTKRRRIANESELTQSRTAAFNEGILRAREHNVSLPAKIVSTSTSPRRKVPVGPHLGDQNRPPPLLADQIREMTTQFKSYSVRWIHMLKGRPGLSSSS